MSTREVHADEARRVLRPASALGLAAALAAAVSVTLSACAGILGTKDPPRGDVGCCQATEGLEIRYLGTGGWLLRFEDSVVLTAPFYTNSGLSEAVFGPIRSDTALVGDSLPDVSEADAILVGHAHYDHLLDVPYVARVRARRATIYGSRTTKNILAGDPDLLPERVVALNELAGTSASPGVWVPVPDSRVRIMALESGHAPHFQGIELYVGTVDEPLSALPDRAEGWVGGQTLAFLIDFLDASGQVAFRVHYQDSAASAPLGLIPELPVDQRAPVDVAILCTPSFSEVRDYPEAIILNTRPRVALLGHWENFFEAPGAKPRSVFLTDVEEFQSRLERVLPNTSVWRLPHRGERFTIAPSGAGAP